MKLLKEITVEVTQKCNSNCLFCSSLSEITSDNEIPLSKLQEISLFVKNKKAAGLNISGGEPLLYPELVSYLSFNKQLNLVSTIYTSGNADFKQFFASIHKTTVSNKDLRFIFNYQSIDCSVFNELTNSTECFSLNTINENISLCLKKGFDVEVHIVPNSKNISTIYETCSFLKSIGISKVSLLRIVYQGRAEKNKLDLWINEKESLPLIIEKIKMELCDDFFSIRVGIPYSNLVSLKTPCYAGTGKIIIKYDGKVFPCEAFKEAPNKDEFVLGDIYVDNLETICNNNLLALFGLKSKIKESSCETCPAQLLYL